MAERWLADAVLLVHLGFVAFVVLGYVAVPLGAALGWGWVRNRTYRLLHLGAIALVAVEALAGVLCPLTWLEWLLRGGSAPQSFIPRLVEALLFYDFPHWVFTVGYVVLTALALALYHWVPPLRPAAAAAPGADTAPAEDASR